MTTRARRGRELAPHQRTTTMTSISQHKMGEYDIHAVCCMFHSHLAAQIGDYNGYIARYGIHVRVGEAHRSKRKTRMTPRINKIQTMSRWATGAAEPYRVSVGLTKARRHEMGSCATCVNRSCQSLDPAICQRLSAAHGCATIPKLCVRIDTHC